MSVQQYQKILSIAEALLRKVDMPHATLVKYEELKEKTLSEGIDTVNISLEIKDDLLNASMTFVTVMSEYIGTIALDGVQDGQFDAHVSPFFADFEHKKKEIRDKVLEASTTVEQKLILKTHLTSLDEMDREFEKVIGSTDSLSELIHHQNQVYETQALRIQKMEEDLEEAMTEVKNSTSAAKEAELMQIQNNELVNKIGAFEIERENFQNSLSKLENEKKKEISSFKEKGAALATKVESLEKLNSDFCSHFAQFSELYNGPGKEADFEEMVQFACEFADRIEGDNRWLLSKVNTCEDQIEELKKVGDSIERKDAMKSRTVEGFVDEIEDIVRFGEKTHMEIEDLEAEYRELIRAGLVRPRPVIIQA